jgi:hypothetical protein
MFVKGGRVSFSLLRGSGLITRLLWNSTFMASAQISESTCLILGLDSKSSIIPESLFKSLKAALAKKLYLPM